MFDREVLDTLRGSGLPTVGELLVLSCICGRSRGLDMCVVSGRRVVQFQSYRDDKR